MKTPKEIADDFRKKPAYKLMPHVADLIEKVYALFVWLELENSEMKNHAESMKFQELVKSARMTYTEKMSR